MCKQIDKRIGVGSAFCSEDFLWCPLGLPELGAAHHHFFQGARFDGVKAC